MTNQQSEGYSLKEAAEALGVSVLTIRRRIKRGELKARMIKGAYGDEYRVDLSSEPLSKDKGDYSALINRLEQLNQEVGYWRGKFEEVASQVKLLEAPKTGSWWRRLFQHDRS